jgi:hypothetical protein
MDNCELRMCKNAHPQSEQYGTLWLPQCVVRDSQQEHQQPFCLTIECVDGTSDVLVADDADGFSALLHALSVRGALFHSVPSGGYVHYRHEYMMKDAWDLCWGVIEGQFLTLWKDKGAFDAAATSSSVGGMGGQVQPLHVMPLICATVIQCTDGVTVSIDLHQAGRVVSTHYLHFGISAACAVWLSGFSTAIGVQRAANLTDDPTFASQSIGALSLKFPQGADLVKTPEPGNIALERGAAIAPKPLKVLPDLVYGSADQLASTVVPPLPEKEKSAWVPLPAAELSKLTAALGNPLEAIGARLSASLSWLKGESNSAHAPDAAAGVSGAAFEALPSSASRSALPDDSSAAASNAAPDSSASTQRSGPTSQSLQSVHSLRHRQPAAVVGAAAPSAATSDPLTLPDLAPHAESAGGLLSGLPLPECLPPPPQRFVSFPPRCWSFSLTTPALSQGWDAVGRGDANFSAAQSGGSRTRFEKEHHEI